MGDSTQCNSKYDQEMRCELKKGHKDEHKFTKYWTDDDD